MQQFVELMRDLATQPNAVTVSFQRIDNFHKLVIDELPYGTIDQNSLVQGLIEIDGPAQTPPNLKKPLQWHFGGIPYEICKAIRIRYAYQKYVDNSYISASGSLFIGYEFKMPHLSDADLANAPSNDVLTTTQELLDALKADFRNSPDRVTALAKYVDAANFDAFLFDNLPFRQGSQTAWQAPWQLGVAPTPLSLILKDETSDGLPGVRIEYDGPARTYDSKKPFPYTTETLFNEPTGMYDRLLWWYFGGRAYRITKAMRLRFDDKKGHEGSLLVGYQGPGPY